MRIRSLLPALVPAVLLVAACGGDRKGADSAAAVASDTTAASVTPAPADSGAGMMAPGTGAGTTASLADASTVPQLDSVNTAAKAGLTSLAPAVAIPLIRSLEDKLDNSNDPALTDIAKDLEKLREELADDTVDAHDVGEIFRRLGPKVTAAASKGGAAQATLTSIGSEITKAGASATFK